jgi:hypothetical protein
MAEEFLKLGSVGVSTRQLQAALNMDANNRALKRRAGIVPLMVDGGFGPNTQTRLIEFQKAQSPVLMPQGVTAPNTWKVLTPLLADAYPFYDVPMIKQGANPICWISCMAMVASEREQMSIGVGAFTGGFDPGNSSIPNPAHGFPDFVARMDRCGFTSINMGRDPADLVVALRDHGPLILSHFCVGFPYGPNRAATTDPKAKHAVVLTGINLTDGYNGSCFMSNPWGDERPVKCSAVLHAISKMQSQGLKAIAYYR